MINAICQNWYHLFGYAYFLLLEIEYLCASFGELSSVILVELWAIIFAEFFYTDDNSRNARSLQRLNLQ